MASAPTVLVIDDDAELRAALGAVLERHGYRVLTAGDGAEGVAVAARERPDLVVADMLMPRMSGFRVLQELKAKGKASPPVLMMTANEGQRHRAYAEALGADDYLHKPFALDRFLERVARLCPPPVGPSGSRGESASR